MNIRVGKYRLSSTNKDFTITEVTKGTTPGNKNFGEEYDTDHSYHPSLPKALENLLKRKVLESDATTLKELLNAHTEARDELNALFSGLA